MWESGCGQQEEALAPRAPGGSSGLRFLLRSRGLKALARAPSGAGKLFADVPSALLPLRFLRTDVADRRHLIKAKTVILLVQMLAASRLCCILTLSKYLLAVALNDLRRAAPGCRAHVITLYICCKSVTPFEALI